MTLARVNDTHISDDDSIHIFHYNHHHGSQHKYRPQCSTNLKHEASIVLLTDSTYSNSWLQTHTGKGMLVAPMLAAAVGVSSAPTTAGGGGVAVQWFV